MSDDSTYIEYSFVISPLYPASEILMAELGELKFESFVETPNGLLAYIQKSDWSKEVLKDVQIIKSEDFRIEASWKEIESENWNAKWESDFNPIIVADQCVVRASFHAKMDVPYEIIIDPKMSFGTGHHETTYMMIQHMLEMDFSGKKVLDMGCGTGVLAILAEMKGADSVLAIDIDVWSYHNAIENCTTNSCQKIEVLQGDAGLIKNKSFDVILANINRNVLLKDIPTYVKSLNPDGTLFLSGFYEDDIRLIEDICIQNMLKPMKKFERNQWVSLKFIN